MDAAEVDAILARFPEARGNLIEILHEIQALYGYLPEAVLRYVADKKSTPMTRLFNIATFYHSFHLTPQGRHKACVCLGTACHVKGSAGLLDELGRRLNVGEGDTTSDSRYTVGVVRCVGACSMAPVMVIDNDTYGGMTSTKVPGILKKYK